ncbi:hypothetical protein PXH59_02675 [Xenorhabdus sp. SF857]|uniref:hypothetical protein n=1 Tax=Xenorhabdus bakwenae TaxID=3026967 RepID=UPI002557DBA3|nr:hypothetical protein [Xenorhabdus sp. SF857]WFQ80104.1 hypothetical protein PXH59_02675 [Xenorhabdus sp. SF857]
MRHEVTLTLYQCSQRTYSYHSSHTCSGTISECPLGSSRTWLIPTDAATQFYQCSQRTVAPFCVGVA